jgi:transcription-repair coupling factor (superfamily II helicase)
MHAILSAFKENPGCRALETYAVKGELPVYVWGLDKRNLPLLVNSLSGEKSIRLIVTYEERRAREIVDSCRLYDREVYYYPAKDLLFYNADIHGSATNQGRLEIVKQIAEGKPVTVVTTIDALMDKLPPMADIAGNAMVIDKSATIDTKEFSDRLVTLGYENVYKVELPGQFSVRGGIIDIFPLTEECPYRIELWGDDIESIRNFDVDSQRSIEETDSVKIYPAGEMSLTPERIMQGIEKIEKEHKAQAELLKKSFRTEQYARLNKTVENIKEELKNFNSSMGLDSMVEYFFDHTVSFLDYFPENTYVYVDEPEKIGSRGESYQQQFAMSMEGRLEGGYILPTQADVLYEFKLILKRLLDRKLILFSELYKRQPKWKEKHHIELKSRQILSFNNSMEALTEYIKKQREDDYRVVILSPSATRAKRIAASLNDDEIPAYFSEKKDRELQPREVFITIGRGEGGFEIPESKLSVICEVDIFTAKELKKKRQAPKYQGDKIGGFSDVLVGDYVVHENHGVGIYRGIEKVETGGKIKDFISIEYAKGSKLFIPVEQLDRIGKLSKTNENSKPKLNVLGGKDWEKVRQRVKGHVEDIARELIDLYAVRETAQGFRFSKDNSWQREFEELFPYEETLDQQKAIDDTKKDMESARIMDRLICGDVGFGKTEVAIRAAFKAVQDNKQVAYLVPTTILAEQHYENFVERMKDYPINVRMLSRFCTPKQTKSVLEELKTGKADIVIGTHRLLSNDIEYHDLGLLIIDEEQRFGVKHKEKIKQIKKNVDVLTLTATPIPRTLHMSMVGLRDISLLEEPPIDRMPIQTYVMEYDLEFVKEAISRELARSGQVYYVYNRVESIDLITAQLKSVLPDAKISFAHGKMPERELEDIMHSFIKKEIDVLVSTTIIETGLDIPNVNTIIIHDADRFGLAQLYQLRGRVGRSDRSAYAFLMYRKDKLLKEVAEKRLKAIREFTDLGSGYKISMRDLEIRGAGNLLGQEQSGNIEAVGYDLYCKMLSDAIARLSGNETEAEFITSIDLPIDAYIPDNYVVNEFAKLDLYKKISKCETLEDNDAIIEEARDRFGEVPRPLLNLLDIEYIKVSAHKRYISDIKYRDGNAYFTLWSGAPLKPEKIPAFIQRYNDQLKMITGANVGFYAPVPKLPEEELIGRVKALIEDAGLLYESITL